jgi:hypothetical protein
MSTKLFKRRQANTPRSRPASKRTSFFFPEKRGRHAAPTLPVKTSLRAIPPASAATRDHASSAPSGAVDAIVDATIAAVVVIVVDAPEVLAADARVDGSNDAPAALAARDTTAAIKADVPARHAVRSSFRKC